MREELETHRSTAQYYEDEYGRLAAKHDEFGKTAYAQLSDMTKQILDFDGRIAAEAAAHGEEVARLKAQIAAAPQEGIDPEMYESEVSALLSTVKDLRNELSVSEGAVKQIRAVLLQ